MIGPGQTMIIKSASQVPAPNMMIQRMSGNASGEFANQNFLEQSGRFGIMGESNGPDQLPLVQTYALDKNAQQFQLNY